MFRNGSKFEFCSDKHLRIPRFVQCHKPTPICFSALSDPDRLDLAQITLEKATNKRPEIPSRQDRQRRRANRLVATRTLKTITSRLGSVRLNPKRLNPMRLGPNVPGSKASVRWGWVQVRGGAIASRDLALLSTSLPLNSIFRNDSNRWRSCIFTTRR